MSVSDQGCIYKGLKFIDFLKTYFHTRIIIGALKSVSPSMKNV